MVDFTKIKWGGTDCILITNRNNWQQPMLLLEAEDIKKLNRVFNCVEGEK